MAAQFPAVTNAQVDLIVTGTIDYIAEQRQTYSARAVALTYAEKQTFTPFFPADVLANTRFTIQEDEPVPNPPFYPQLAGMGFRPEHLPNFSMMAGITFVDVVVLQVPPNPQLVFHELVHAVQYQRLGLAQFAPLYVRGFLQGGGYDGIPLEINAYHLEERFVANPRQAFSVADEVDGWIMQGRF
jgi:hypothetical protein